MCGGVRLGVYVCACAFRGMEGALLLRKSCVVFFGPSVREFGQSVGGDV
jgi:hypothetical protein